MQKTVSLSDKGTIYGVGDSYKPFQSISPPAFFFNLSPHTQISRFGPSQRTISFDHNFTY